MLTPFRFGAGGPIGGGRQYMSWIAIDDVIGAVLHALTTPALSGPVNAVAPNPCTTATSPRRWRACCRGRRSCPCPPSWSSSSSARWATSCYSPAPGSSRSACKDIGLRVPLSGARTGAAPSAGEERKFSRTDDSSLSTVPGPLRDTELPLSLPLRRLHRSPVRLHLRRAARPGSARPWRAGTRRGSSPAGRCAATRRRRRRAVRSRTKLSASRFGSS